jgi:hypothetical protein
MNRKRAILKATNFEELLAAVFGKIGAKKRDTFENGALFFSIGEVLKELEKLLYGFNYECHFTFEKRENIQQENLKPVSYADFKKDINEKLDYRGDKGAGLTLSPVQEENLRQKIRELRILLEQMFPRNATEIFIHPEIYTSIFWGFCYLIVFKNELYLFEGTASD